MEEIQIAIDDERSKILKKIVNLLCVQIICIIEYILNFKRSKLEQSRLYTRVAVDTKECSTFCSVSVVFSKVWRNVSNGGVWKRHFLLNAIAIMAILYIFSLTIQFCFILTSKKSMKKEEVKHYALYPQNIFKLWILLTPNLDEKSINSYSIDLIL